MKRHEQGTFEYEQQTVLCDSLPHAVHPMHGPLQGGNWRTKADALLDGIHARGWTVVPVADETDRTTAIAAVASAFEGEGEAWWSDHSGDHLAAVAVDALIAAELLTSGASAVAGPAKARATVPTVVLPTPVIYSEEDGRMVALVLPVDVVRRLREVLHRHVTPAMGLDQALYDEIGHQLEQAL